MAKRKAKRKAKVKRPKRRAARRVSLKQESKLQLENANLKVQMANMAKEINRLQGFVHA